MNNEPVAWAIKVGKDLIEIVDEMRDFQELVDFYKSEQWYFEEVPLYLNPVKELTDEEMKDLIQEYWGDVHIVDPDGYLHEIAFIRAILRKASEK